MMTSELTMTDLVVMGGEPTILDLRLAELLGYKKTHDIRELIARKQDELSRYGEVFRTVRKTSSKGGRPGGSYYLNEPQALLISVLSDAPNAPEVRREVISVFVAFRRGEILPALVDPQTPAPMDRQARDLAILEHVRLTKGPAAAARLYDTLPSMPKVPRELPAPIDPDGLACLRHLFAQEYDGITIGEMIKQLFRNKELARNRLARLKIEQIDDGFTVPNVHDKFYELFDGTPWERPFEHLRKLPGTKPHHPHGGKWAGQRTFIPSTYLSEC